MFKDVFWIYNSKFECQFIINRSPSPPSSIPIDLSISILCSLHFNNQMVKTKRKASNSSTPRRGVKKKIQTIPKKKQVTKILRPNGYKEYRLVLPLTGLDGTMVKHQGPRLCSPGHVKLYFSPHNRILLGVWTHNAHLLPPNYSACVTGYKQKYCSFFNF